MSNIIPFNYNSKQVRVIQQDGEPWWVLKDVCEILGLSNPSVVADRLDDDERSKFDLGRQGEATIVNESGLYNVILRSDKPEAKQFKRWITHEVLPAVRRHGGYLTPQKVEEILMNPDTIIQLATALKDERKKRLALEPKAQSYDILMDSTGCLTMNEVAKILDIKGIGQNNLFKLLVIERIIYKKGNSYLPYQEYKSHFIVKQNPICKGDAIIERSQLYMTPRGLDWLAHKLIDRGYAVNYYKGKVEVTV